MWKNINSYKAELKSDNFAWSVRPNNKQDEKNLQEQKRPQISNADAVSTSIRYLWKRPAQIITVQHSTLENSPFCKRPPKCPKHLETNSNE